MKARPGGAHIRGFFGASGSGKSAAVKQAIAGDDRLMVWDVMDEYADHAARATKLVDVVKVAKVPGAFAVRYVPEGDRDRVGEKFAAFCAIAYAVGNVSLVVEELQTVTRPSWAPAEWSSCTLRGRHRGLRIYGVSQRPASVDKDFFSNATTIRSGRLNFVDDVRTMAQVLAVPESDVRALVPLEYIERDMGTGVLTRDVVRFGEKKPRKRK